MTSLNIFGRPINYNEGSYKQDLLQSMRPGQYVLDPNYANRKVPRRVQDIGFIGTQGASLSRNKSLVDIDTQMRMPYAATRDPAQKHQATLETWKAQYIITHYCETFTKQVSSIKNLFNHIR